MASGDRFGGAVLGLFVTGHPVLGTSFGVLALANTVAATIWRVRGDTLVS